MARQKSERLLKRFKKIGNTEVYLPKGANWTDFWTGQTLEGGQTIQREVPIDIMPIYVRAGSILPWGPAVQYSTEKKWDNLTIRIYPGADAEFTLMKMNLIIIIMKRCLHNHPDEMG